MILPPGKLSIDFLQEILPKFQNVSRLIAGPTIGEDAAVIDFGETCLVATTDPITFATEEIGWYLVCVNSNDIATMGAVPKWLLVSILLPENQTTEDLVRNIMLQITSACRQFDITLCGGHTEVTCGLNRPIVIGQMLGEVKKENLITAAGARAGDDLILTKGIGIEATAIIAREQEGYLSNRFSPAFLKRARSYLTNPGISVLKEAAIAAGIKGVHAMHDPTEGGVATAIHELAYATKLGAILWEKRLIISEETEQLCAEFHLNPLGVISSGALLIAAAPAYTKEILFALSNENISCEVVGQLLAPDSGLWLETDDQRRPLPIFETDEITKIL